MCAIIGSRNIDTLRELVELNSYRGSHSYSLSFFSTYTNVLQIQKKSLGAINLDYVKIPTSTYCIVHVQAPTTDARSEDYIHPAVIDYKFRSYPLQALWHNGIIKEEVVKSLSEKYNSIWDTDQILQAIKDGDWNTLSQFDGTFSCLYYDLMKSKLMLFRNEISPMFIDDDMNISSTKFPGSRETDPNVVFEMDLKHNTLLKVGEFKTVENPYFFMNE